MHNARMTYEQNLAVDFLELALLECRRHNVSLIGMNDNLLAFDLEALRNEGFEKFPDADARETSIKAMHATGWRTVADNNSYVISGNW